jgi:2-phosphosulfolactate phosphatase
MRIHTDLTPAESYQDVVVLVDVLRAATVAPLLFERGIDTLALTPSLRSARGAAREGWLLLGERQGVPPEGFNYGNSPAELAAIDFTGKRAVVVSENAPRWLARVAGARRVLLGSLYNAAAAAEAASRQAQETIALAACGFEGEPDLDDTLGAGLVAAILGERLPSAVRSGATRFAMSLLRAFPDPMEALWQSVAGHALRRVGLERDLAFAAQVSASVVVPQLVGQQAGAGSAPLYLFAPASRPS